MIEMLQVGAEAAKQSSYINVAIPTAFVTSAITIIGREIVAAFIGRKKEKNGGPKAGESETCREHGEDIATLMQFKLTSESALIRIENKVDKLLARE